MHSLPDTGVILPLPSSKRPETTCSCPSNWTCCVSTNKWMCHLAPTRTQQSISSIGPVSAHLCTLSRASLWVGICSSRAAWWVKSKVLVLLVDPEQPGSQSDNGSGFLSRPAQPARAPKSSVRKCAVRLYTCAHYQTCSQAGPGGLGSWHSFFLRPTDTL